MPVDILVGMAVGAAAASTSVRKVVRRGVVYGLAGGLIAYDKMAGFASGVVRGAREGMASKNGKAPEPAPTPPAELGSEVPASNSFATPPS